MLQEIVGAQQYKAQIERAAQHSSGGHGDEEVSSPVPQLCFAHARKCTLVRSHGFLSRNQAVAGGEDVEVNGVWGFVPYGFNIPREAQMVLAGVHLLGLPREIKQCFCSVCYMMLFRGKVFLGEVIGRRDGLLARPGCEYSYLH